MTCRMSSKRVSGAAMPVRYSKASGDLILMYVCRKIYGAISRTSWMFRFSCRVADIFRLKKWPESMLKRGRGRYQEKTGGGGQSLELILKISMWERMYRTCATLFLSGWIS